PAAAARRSAEGGVALGRAVDLRSVDANRQVVAADERRQLERLVISPIAGGVGPGRERQWKLSRPGMPRLSAMLLLPRSSWYARRSSARRQPRALFQRPGITAAGRQFLAGLSDRRLVRAAHAPKP